MLKTLLLKHINKIVLNKIEKYPFEFSYSIFFKD